jgi:hypothetical protein
MDEEREVAMKRKTFTPEQIIGKLREAEVLLSQARLLEQSVGSWRS